MSSFFHDVSNVVAIIQGKVRHAELMLNALSDREKIDPIEKKIASVLEDINRLVVILKAEKEARLPELEK